MRPQTHVPVPHSIHSGRSTATEGIAAGAPSSALKKKRRFMSSSYRCPRPQKKRATSRVSHQRGLFNPNTFMTFERTFDYPLLTKLLKNPSLYNWISDDFSPPIEEVKAVEFPDLWYILARDDGGDLLGFFCLAPRTAICWELHTVMPLNAKAIEAMKALFTWLWEQAGITRIVTNVPSFNRVALRFAKRVGFRQFGINEKSYRKSGFDHDQVLFGVTRPGA